MTFSLQGGAVTLGDKEITGDQWIWLDPDMEGDWVRMVKNIAHESWHAHEGCQSDSLEEEARAYYLQYCVMAFL
jgi:hypothetical protein